VLLSKGDQVDAGDFQFAAIESQVNHDNGFVAPRQMTLEDIERELISQTLER
jgi:hypothetical protein